MKKVFQITRVCGLVVMFWACSGGEKQTELKKKQDELANLKKEYVTLTGKISSLEQELSVLDTAKKDVTKLIAVESLQQSTFNHYIDLQGIIDAEDISYVAPRGMGGVVKSILVKQGDVVKKGQLLLKLDDALQRQGVASATQGAENVKTQLALAKNLYQRYKNLWDQNIGSEVQLLTAKNNVDALENQLKMANEGIKMAQEQLLFSEVRSDISGAVDLLAVKVGEIYQGMTAMGPQLRIVNNNRLKAVVDIPENYMTRIHKGSIVEIGVSDISKSYSSTINFISSAINTSTRGFNAEAKVPTDNLIKPKQIAQIRILDYSANNAITVPVNMIQTDEKGKYVFVVVKEGSKLVARKKAIVIGESYDARMEVKSGLEVGDQLVTEGYQTLYEGQLVSLEASK
jgi:hypothetical protein